MTNIMEYLDREQEHKLAIEDIKYYKNRVSNAKKLALAVAKLDIEFIRMRNAGVKNLHPEMLKRLSNCI